MAWFSSLMGGAGAAEGAAAGAGARAAGGAGTGALASSPGWMQSLGALGQGSPYAALGNALGGAQGQGIGQVAGGVSALAGPSEMPAGAPAPPNRQQEAPGMMGPVSGLPAPFTIGPTGILSYRRGG